MNRRDTVLALFALGASSIPAAVNPQTIQKPWRIGTISAGTRRIVKPYEDAFLAGMREYGYAVGRNLVVDWRYAEGRLSRLPELAGELIAQKPDVLLGSNAGVAIAMKEKTTTIPIVLCTVSDAVGIGLARSLARPAGNVTGLSLQLHELGAKHIEIMAELLPRMHRVAVLTDASQPKLLSGAYEHLAQRVAAAKRFDLSEHRVDSLEEIHQVFGLLAKSRTDAVLLNPSPRFNTMRREICKAAADIRLPTIAWEEDIAEAGGLMSYGPSFKEAYRRVAYFVDRILKGARPSDLPIEQPTKFELVINLRTAKTIGITIPSSVLLRADRVIE